MLLTFRQPYIQRKRLLSSEEVEGFLKELLMSFCATVVNLMIASPSDVDGERNTVRDIIAEWNTLHAEKEQLVLLPVGWETHSSPRMGDRPQELINRQVVERCDLLVAVFWTRLGSQTGKAPSGTVEEIEKHLAENRPAMIYFSNVPIPPASIDGDQYRALHDFRTACEKRGLVYEFSSREELRDSFRRHLGLTISECFSKPMTARQDEELQVFQATSPSHLSPEASQLLTECSLDAHRTILCTKVMTGLAVETNGSTFNEIGDARSEAEWKAALEELANRGFVEQSDDQGEVFVMTKAGFEAADKLSEREQ
jgi:hypothetical protein